MNSGNMADITKEVAESIPAEEMLKTIRKSIKSKYSQNTIYIQDLMKTKRLKNL